MVAVNITTDPIRGAILRMMISAARDLNDTGRLPGEKITEVNDEYVRGQVELICNTIGLSSDDYREDLTRIITLRAPIAITTTG
jgi:hypothetical protein